MLIPIAIIALALAAPLPSALVAPFVRPSAVPVVPPPGAPRDRAPDSGDPLAVVRAYERAANSHDADAVLALLADRPVIDMGGDLELVGRAAVQSLHDWDRAMATEIRYSDCHASGSLVTCRATERNDLLRLAGLTSVDYRTSMLTIEEGRVVRMSAELTDASSARVNEFMGRFLGWASEHHAEALAEVVREDGSIAFSYDNALALKRLARLYTLSLPGLSRVL